jgi:hypothetical protein
MAVAPATAAARVTKRQFAIQLSKPAMEYFIAGFAFVDAFRKFCLNANNIFARMCFASKGFAPKVATQRQRREI